MIIIQAELYQLKIPFKLSFSHSKAERFFSDSIILELTGEDSLGNQYTGYGEAVVREYVSGSLESADSSEAAQNNPMELLKNTFTELLEPFREKNISTEDILNILKAINPPVEQLPLLCAIEIAILDLLCTSERVDIYKLLRKPPVREQLSYGGTLPLLSAPAAEKLMQGYKKMGIGCMRVKIGSDNTYNDNTLSIVRKMMGDDFDIKVDANAGWSLADAETAIPVLKKHGVSIIEEPFGRETEAAGCQSKKRIIRLMKSEASRGMIFMADESALNIADVRLAAAEKTFGMINIRLAKNGGLLKALDMAETAGELGISYMAGCHVGETGILSAAGRAAASMMKNPQYVDGSYDSHLLSGNITDKDLSFGAGGIAGIIRNRGIGYKIDKLKLEGFTHEKIRCF